MKRILTTISLAVSLTATTAHAQNAFYAPGDLVLFFQKPGNTNTIYANLGNAATVFRGAAAGPDGANKVEFLNLSATLTSAFGAGWASDPDIYAGLAGVYDDSSLGSTLKDGDPARTLYVSASRSAVGTVGSANSTARDMFNPGSNAMTDAASGIISQNNVLETSYSTQVAVSPTSISQIDDQNTFLSPGIQAAAMGGNLDGGIQQRGSATSFGTFGYAGSVEFALDLYRVLAKNTISGQVGGSLRVGSFEGTVTVGTNGKVSFLTPPTGYDTWVLGFPALDTDAKRMPSADPDNDGMSNLMEFVLTSDPGVSSQFNSSGQSYLPTVDTSGTSCVFTFRRKDISETNSTLHFQYGNSLTSWTDFTLAGSNGGSGTSSYTAGPASYTVQGNGSNADKIVVTVPKSAVIGDKLFGHLKVTRP